MEIEAKIATYLVHAGWAEAEPVVKFLAAGEYNENYLVIDDLGEKRIFRINHGTQLGLKNQIEYEFNVLKAVEKEMMAKGFTKSQNPAVLVSIFTKANSYYNYVNTT